MNNLICMIYILDYIEKITYGEAEFIYEEFKAKLQSTNNEQTKNKNIKNDSFESVTTNSENCSRTSTPLETSFDSGYDSDKSRHYVQIQSHKGKLLIYCCCHQLPKD